MFSNIQWQCALPNNISVTHCVNYWNSALKIFNRGYTVWCHISLSCTLMRPLFFGGSVNILVICFMPFGNLNLFIVFGVQFFPYITGDRYFYSSIATPGPVKFHYRYFPSPLQDASFLYFNSNSIINNQYLEIN